MQVISSLILLLTTVDIPVALIGIVLAIIFAIVASSQKDQAKKSKFKKFAKWFLLPLLILVGLFVLTFIVNVVAGFMGQPSTTNTLPGLKPTP